MGLFANTFSSILKESCTSCDFNILKMMSGKKTRHKEKRHRRPLILDPFKRKHAQTVPDMHKPDMSLIQQVEKIKNNPRINIPLNIVQLRAICKKYGIYSVSKLEPKKLGNTGIMIIWNEPTQTFILKK